MVKGHWCPGGILYEDTQRKEEQTRETEMRHWMVSNFTRYFYKSDPWSAAVGVTPFEQFLEATRGLPLSTSIPEDEASPTFLITEYYSTE